MKEESFTNEQWRPIEGFPRYQVSDMGRVKSFTNPKKPKILRPFRLKSGYMMVHLVRGEQWGNCNTECIRVHKLVADAFIPNPQNKCHITHINRDRSDNRAENLRWITREESINDPVNKANRMAAIPQRVEKMAKPVLVYDENLTLLSAFTSTAEAARQLNLQQGNIVNVCSGSLPHYKHLIFTYTPLNSKEDREKQLQDGEEKKRRRLSQVNKACQKLYWREPEKYREKAKGYMKKLYDKKKRRREEEAKKGILPST